eukprot:GEZU01015855.1.p1 GENE.GEZU01015855.1~~GEZU01015855.1.p1  ORF type:complete len:128 (-),score=7.90 GEZU01015855.1:374-715(-)
MLSGNRTNSKKRRYLEDQRAAARASAGNISVSPTIGSRKCIYCGRKSSSNWKKVTEGLLTSLEAHDDDEETVASRKKTVASKMTIGDDLCNLCYGSLITLAGKSVFFSCQQRE